MKKKISFILAIVAICAFTGVKDPLTEKERKFASEFLSNTQNTLVDITKGLSEEQLKYKTTPDRWSIEDCVKHIAAAENGLWMMADSIIKSPANPEKRSEIKTSDEQIITMITDRSFKAQAPESLKPQNTPFKTYPEAIKSFNDSRSKRSNTLIQPTTICGVMWLIFRWVCLILTRCYYLSGHILKDIRCRSRKYWPILVFLRSNIIVPLALITGFLVMRYSFYFSFNDQLEKSTTSGNALSSNTISRRLRIISNFLFLPDCGSVHSMHLQL